MAQASNSNEGNKRKFTDRADPINFNDPNISHDRILVVEDKRFFVVSGVLSISSDHFRALFSSSFAEANQQQIVLKDVSAANFDYFLKIIYPSHLSEPAHVLLSRVGPSVILELISMSFRFLCPAVYQVVKGFMDIEFGKNQLKRYDLVALIDLVILHDLDDLKEMVIKTLADKAFSASRKDAIMNAPDHVKDFIIEAYMDGKIQSKKARDRSPVSFTTVSVFGRPQLPKPIVRVPRGGGGF